MKWPVIYIDLNIDEELFVITYEDWFHDVDAKHAISPISGKTEFFIDSNEQIYKLQGGNDKHGVPDIQVGAQIINETVLKTMRERALKWNKISSKDIHVIIREARLR